MFGVLGIYNFAPDPIFGRSVNPIPTRGDRLCPPNYYWYTLIFRPSDGPDIIYPQSRECSVMLMSSIEGSSKKVPKSGIGCNSVEVMDSGGYSQCSKYLKAIQNKFIKPWTRLGDLSLRYILLL